MAMAATGVIAVAASANAQDFAALVDDVNTTAISQGRNVVVLKAEYFGAGDSIDANGRTVFFSNRGNKQLSGDFVPAAYGLQLDNSDDVSYYVDDNRATFDIPVAASNAALDRAMATWDGVKCSTLNMTEFTFDGRRTGFIAALLGDPNGSFDYVADITHAGWLPAVVFDFFLPGGGSSILGVTFSIAYVDDEGNPTDVDNNGKADVAWREIYFNDGFEWNDGSGITFDIETVGLHEAGHGLSQDHFGDAFRTQSNNKLHFAPRAVMNASYTGVQRKIAHSDNGGHCSNWAQWPNN